MFSKRESVKTKVFNVKAKAVAWAMHEEAAIIAGKHGDVPDKTFDKTFGGLLVGEVSIGLDIDPEKGSADSGDLEIDLPNLFLAIGEAAENRNSAVAIFIDAHVLLDSFTLPTD